MTDLRTFDQVAAHTTMLTVARSRCERGVRCRQDTLIARHDVDAPVRVIVPALTADCL